MYNASNSDCLGCLKETGDVFSDVDSDDDNLPHQLLDKYLDKSNSNESKEISDRPCFHGNISTPMHKFNVAGLQFSYSLTDNIEHIPQQIVLTDKCPPEDFYDLVGCTKDTTEVLTNIIVIKFIPEDIEDEIMFESLYQHLVNEERFARSELRCKKFQNIFTLPLPKENEPPAFLPIDSRINLESAPREDNLLLGILLKRPRLEDGEILDVESMIISPEPGDNISSKDSTISSEALSPVSLDSGSIQEVRDEPSTSKGDGRKALDPNRSKSLLPENRYDSYIGCSTEDIPFLTDPVDKPENQPENKLKVSPKKYKSSKRGSSPSLQKYLEEISSTSDDEPKTWQKKPSHERTISESSHKDSHTHRKLKRKQNASTQLSPESHSKSSGNKKISPKKSKATLPDKQETRTQDKRTKSTEEHDLVSYHSSETDPESDCFSLTLNTSLKGRFSSPHGDFEFKYDIIRSDRENTSKYLPSAISLKGRLRALETENFLKFAYRKPGLKVILFQILPANGGSDKLVLENLTTILRGRDRYGLVDYRSKTYRVYLFPAIKDKPLMEAFKVIKLKPKLKSDHELYGLIIKKSAMEPPRTVNQQQGKPKPNQPPEPKASTSGKAVQPSASPSSSSSSSYKAPSLGTKKISESSEFHNLKLKGKYGPENYPQVGCNQLAKLIHSSIGDLLKLNSELAGLIQSSTKGLSLKEKVEATQEVQSKVIYISGLEDQQHAMRKKAYDAALAMLKTLCDKLPKG